MDRKTDQKGCAYCKMLNKKIIEGPGHLLDNKPLLPFVSISYNFKSENGISSKGLQARFCPMCGTEVES